MNSSAIDSQSAWTNWIIAVCQSLFFLLFVCSLCFLTACNGGSGGSANHALSGATHFSVSAPGFATTGTPVSFVVTALDASNNVVASYSGTVQFTSTDAKATLPASSTLTMGTGNFFVTFNTLGNQTITATDTASLSGKSTAIDVVTATATTHFSVTNNGGGAGTRSPITVSVVALDGSNNPSTGYSGTVQITSSDSKAILPANAPLQNGAGNFQLTFETAGNQIVTATDTTTPALTGTSGTIAVAATAAPAITSASPPSGTVGDKYAPHTVKVCVFPNPTGGCFGYENKTVFFFPFTASSGVGSDTWSWAPVAPSTLPPGLKLANGEISGTPTAAGTYQVSVTVTDSGSPQAQTSANYSITIANPPPPTVGPSPLLVPGAALNRPYSFTFTATEGKQPYQNWNETGALPPGLAFSNEGVLSGAPTETGSFPIAVTVQDSTGLTSAAQDYTIQVFSHGFSATGSMETARLLQSATLLNSGKVLIAGGQQDINTLFASAELYDPTAGTFSATGSMQISRSQHTATLLNDGRVLLVGGGTGTQGNATATAEFYDPTGATSTATGSMQTPRWGHTATLLSNGKVLVTGGVDATGAVATAELYDPASGTFSPTGSMETARYFHTATLLSSGKVLIAGGSPGSGGLATAELYDPASGTFSPTGTMQAERSSHTATLLNTGKVLIVGGADTTTAELFDPTAGTFSPTGAVEIARAEHAATLLPDGTVLVVGGLDPNFGNALAVVELFDPTAGTFAATGGLGTARVNPTATLLKNGQ
ncbi:MAG TPA: kelch repeat-containing protein, partial [Candidatus Limnocylindrales bacterium]|nr:kelch repeat-containing protein [Candidatus Limnocylindrales bacterium]